MFSRRLGADPTLAVLDRPVDRWCVRWSDLSLAERGAGWSCGRQEIGMIAMLDLARLLYSFRECHGGLESDEQRWSGASRWID